ncbi:MAG: MATE family efflux transporter [Acetivibrionales bacterium]|jgi:putative MATE family efflux protein|nr:MATE family efflux transporter [Clostridiaceae bacterium]
MEQIKENKMGHTPIFRLIISMSLPSMFSMLIQSLYNIIDSMFVAQICEDALTALSLAFPVQLLMISVAVGTGVGVNSLISRRLGEGRHDEASNAASHGLVLSFISWLPFALIGLFFTKPFFEAFSTNLAVVEMGCEYLSIVTVFSLGVFIQISFEKTLQATGNMIYPMISQLIGAITNIILDPIMIFGLFGFPELGVGGAAIATVIGQIFGMLFCVLIIYKKNHDVHITLKRFRFRGKIVKEIYQVGLPSIIMQSIASVLIGILNAILGTLSETAIAVLGAYYKLQSFIFMPVFGLTQGVMPVMGYNFGAKNKKRLIDTLKVGLLVAVAIMAFGTSIFMFVPDKLLMIFNASEEMLLIGMPALRIISLCFIPAAVGIMFSTLFQALGAGIYSLIISVMRQLIFILPAAYLLSKIGLNFVWYSFPIAEVFSFIASILLFRRVYRNSIKILG